MVLENKLGITDQAELDREEERLGKLGALDLFDTGDIDRVGVGTFNALALIHRYLFQDIYDWAGTMREVNLARGNFRFAPALHLEQSLRDINAMPHDDFENIVKKYVEMNIAHPFRDGNGRAARIWLDCLLKVNFRLVADWDRIDKDAYLSAMERSPVDDSEIKHILENTLTDKTKDRETFMQGIDASFRYEGYSAFKTDEIKS